MSTTHLSGPLAVTSLQTISGPGAIDVVTDTTEITTAGVGDAFTLVDGTQGQRKRVLYAAEGGGTDTAILTPSNLAGGSTITFSDVGEAVDLEFSGGTWYVVSGNGIVIA